ncbi:hypothetical protein [Kaarinaea lacus]
MHIKTLSLILIIIVAMHSTCANSGDKWKTDTSDNAANPESGWQQNQQSTSEQKKSPGSYWTEEHRY